MFLETSSFENLYYDDPQDGDVETGEFLDLTEIQLDGEAYKSKSLDSIFEDMHLDVLSPMQMKSNLTNRPKTPSSLKSRRMTPLIPMNATHAALWKFQPGVEKVFYDMTKSQVHLQECWHEFVSSEQSFVKDLESTIRIFYGPIVKFNVITLTENGEPIEADRLFGDIPKIAKINAVFLSKLNEQKAVTWPIYKGLSPHILEFFKKIESNYVSHCDRIKQCNNLINILFTRDKSFRMFMDTVTKNDGVDVLGLQSYIIKPLQRVTKYSLLLREIMKAMDPSDPELSVLNECFAIVNAALTNINELTKGKEIQEKMFEIQTSLDFSEVKPFTVIQHDRFFVKEARIYIETTTRGKVNGSIKERYCFLFNDSMLITKTPKTKKSANPITALKGANDGIMRKTSSMENMFSGGHGLLNLSNATLGATSDSNGTFQSYTVLYEPVDLSKITRIVNKEATIYNFTQSSMQTNVSFAVATVSDPQDPKRNQLWRNILDRQIDAHTTAKNSSNTEMNTLDMSPLPSPSINSIKQLDKRELSKSDSSLPHTTPSLK